MTLNDYLKLWLFRLTMGGLGLYLLIVIVLSVWLRRQNHPTDLPPDSPPQ